MPGDLADLRHLMQLCQRPGLLVQHQPRHFQPIIVAIDIRRLILAIESIKREWPSDHRFGILWCQMVGIEQPALNPIVKA
ncbi:hypothetical protein D3C75_1228000 [compost metagenome]